MLLQECVDKANNESEKVAAKRWDGEFWIRNFRNNHRIVVTMKRKFRSRIC